MKYFIHSVISLYISSIKEKPWTSTKVQLRAFWTFITGVFRVFCVLWTEPFFRVRVRARVCVEGVCVCVESVEGVYVGVCAWKVCVHVLKVCVCMCVESVLKDRQLLNRGHFFGRKWSLNHRGCWDQTCSPSDAGKRSKLPPLTCESHGWCDVGVMWCDVVLCLFLSFSPLSVSLSSRRFCSECCSSSSSS